MPMGWLGLVVIARLLLVYGAIFAVVIVVARFLLIRAVRIVRREWTKPQEPGA